MVDIRSTGGAFPAGHHRHDQIFPVRPAFHEGGQHKHDRHDRASGLQLSKTVRTRPKEERTAGLEDFVMGPDPGEGLGIKSLAEAEESSLARSGEESSPISSSLGHIAAEPWT